MCARRGSGVWLTFADHQHVVVLFVVVQAHLRATSPLATGPDRAPPAPYARVREAGALTLQRSSSSSDTSNRCSDSTHECNSRSVKASSRVARAAIGEPTALYLPSPSMTRTSDRGGGDGTAGGLGGAHVRQFSNICFISALNCSTSVYSDCQKTAASQCRTKMRTKQTAPAHLDLVGNLADVHRGRDDRVIVRVDLRIHGLRKDVGVLLDSYLRSHPINGMR